jgi:hypothetical protein
MVRTTLAALTVAAALGQSVALAVAGPCTEQITQIEQAVRASASVPDAGPMAAQSVGAQLHRQPTPNSIKQAQQQTDAQFQSTLASAKDLDAQGKRAECTAKVDELKRLLDLE